jgi:hypothetical protein
VWIIGNLVFVLVLMNAEVLCEVAEVVIGVSHDGRQDPKWNGKPGYMSEDDLWEDLTGHGKVTIEQLQDNRTMFLIFGSVERCLEGDVDHVGCC